MKKIIALLTVLLLTVSMLPLWTQAAETETVAYLDNVSGNDANDGLSATTAKKTFGSLTGNGVLGMVKDGGTVVVVGKAWIARDWTLPKASGTVTFTAAYGGKDYKVATPETNPDTSFKMASGATLTIENDVVFDDIILFQENKQNTIQVAAGATLTITDKAVLMSKPGNDYHFRILLENGATAILSEEAQKKMEISGEGGRVLTWTGEGSTPTESTVKSDEKQETTQPDAEFAYMDSSAGNDKNDGLTGKTPKKTFGTTTGKGTLGMLPDGGTIVAVGKIYVARDWTFPQLSGELTFTSNYGGKDYKNPEPITNPTCAFKMASGATMTIESDMRFDDIILFQENKQNTIRVSAGTTLIITDKAVMMTKPGNDYHYRIVIEDGATAILSKAAQEVMTIENEGTLLTYVSDTEPEEKFQPSRAYENQFTDVTNDKWFYSYVKTAYEYALANGTSASKFSPDGKFTVAQALTAAVNIHKAYNGTTVRAAASGEAWYTPYVEYCIEKGIITANQFADYNKNITRGEMAIVFANILPESEYAAIRSYTLSDMNDTLPSAAAVKKLANAGIVGGSNGKYNPNDDIKRSEACVIFTRIAVASMRDSKAN